MSRPAIWGLLAFWALAMALSGFAWLAEPTGDGFTRGMNRLMGFLGWQLAGGVLALVLVFARRRLAPGDGLRRLTILPTVVAGLLVLAVAGIVVSAHVTGARAPEPETRPVTQPAAPVAPGDG